MRTISTRNVTFSWAHHQATRFTERDITHNKITATANIVEFFKIKLDQVSQTKPHIRKKRQTAPVLIHLCFIIPDTINPRPRPSQSISGPSYSNIPFHNTLLSYPVACTYKPPKRKANISPDTALSVLVAHERATTTDEKSTISRIGLSSSISSSENGSPNSSSFSSSSS